MYAMYHALLVGMCLNHGHSSVVYVVILDVGDIHIPLIYIYKVVYSILYYFNAITVRIHQ